ncbi:SDR family NAD(P)-dependent oxidoreductase [Actinoallomurus rhizosphaericola]|uniref:SDR family NAD(P)-dependent oxidoreductase n=1 Tax=Actinoallomurus rhizosphaericola TaxID=2952536 RepID=UPI0020939DC3|nr:SDR family NAD(P)-dependent oxidoreductase [Actinoallomurus rhizosphaericola]MCO5999711.1 SDR family NAD(P)-dependent oxidoreductase [Actinoallomurus rhizosphaericola]
MGRPNDPAALSGRRVLVTGAARGIGAALARRLHARGARVALAGLEPDGLAAVARDCADAPWRTCDVTDRDLVEWVVAELADRLGGLDVVVANAGVACQWPLLGGDPEVLETTMRVNVFGTYHTLRSAGPYIAHPEGYALAVASLAAAVHAPLLGAYSASKAAVEALGDTLRVELRHTGARVGVAYFAELDTDMTHRGFGTRAAAALQGRRGAFTGVTPLRAGIDALERGIATRARRVHAPRWVGPVLYGRMAAQRVLETAVRARVEPALRIAAEEDPPLTTPQPEEQAG